MEVLHLGFCIVSTISIPQVYKINISGVKMYCKIGKKKALRDNKTENWTVSVIQTNRT